MVLESSNACAGCWVVAIGVAIVSEIRTAKTILGKKSLDAPLGAALATGISVPPEVAKSRFTEYKR